MQSWAKSLMSSPGCGDFDCQFASVLVVESVWGDTHTNRRPQFLRTAGRNQMSRRENLHESESRGDASRGKRESCFSISKHPSERTRAPASPVSREDLTDFGRTDSVTRTTNSRMSSRMSHPISPPANPLPSTPFESQRVTDSREHHLHPHIGSRRPST